MIEALMERIFYIKVSEIVVIKFKEISKKLVPYYLYIDRLFHKIPDLPDKNNFK